jgi:predicted dehydrogenase
MTTENKLRGAIIGYGFISSKGHMPAYLERIKNKQDVKIVAICDVCPEREIDSPPGVKFYNDYRELLSEEKELDFVDVSTHAAHHYKIAKLALQQGLHVLCEKPLAVSTDEADDLIKTANACQRVLFPCHNYKYAPVICAIREIIDSGKIGKIKSVTMNTFRNTHAIGTKEWKPNWRREREYSGGGIAMDHGSHSLYLLFDWMGGYPKSVTASSENYSYPIYDTEDNFSATYEFENGHADLHLSWTAGIRKVIYSLQGEKGAISVDDDHIQLAVMKENENVNSSHKAQWLVEDYNVKSDWMDSSHTSWFNTMFDQFKIAIENNDYQNKEIIDAHACIQSITKAYESIRNNSIKLAFKNEFQLGGLQ